MTPAEQLRAAAARLHPSSPSVASHTVAVRLAPEVVDALADWLAAEAARLTKFTHPDWQGTVAPHALAVARAVLGTPEQP
jgi:hypothetical protein